ncbi:MAG: hypothetical protein JWO73_281 [Candidatus Taylorbacteria bacterium]|nr:hypothetical protein [Candidatus Taylorbacteria bacterium]
MNELPSNFRKSFLITAILLAFFLVSSNISYAFSFNDLLQPANKGMQVVGNSALQALSFESIKSFIPDVINRFASNLNCTVDEVIGRDLTAVCAKSPAILASRKVPASHNLASVDPGKGALASKDKPAANPAAAAPDQTVAAAPAVTPRPQTTTVQTQTVQVASVSSNLSSAEFAAIQRQLADVFESIRLQSRQITSTVDHLGSASSGGGGSVNSDQINGSISGLSSRISSLAASSTDAGNITAGILSIPYGGTGTSTAPAFGQLLLGNANGGYDLVSTSSLGIVGAGSVGTSTINFGTTGQLAYYASDGTAVSGISTSSLGLTTSNIAEGSNLYFTALRASTTAGQVVAAATSTVRNFISSSASGLTYAPSTGIFSLTSGFNIPLSASSTEWASFFNAPSSRITAGNLLSWTGNTLNVSTSSLGLTTSNIAEGSNLYYTDARASTTAINVLAATTSLPNIATLAGLTSAPSLALSASNITSGVLAVARGGTGTTTAPTLGQILLGNSAGGYNLVGTSTLGFLTTDVSEGSNLYYTDVRADARIAAATSTVRNFISSSASGLTYAPSTGIFSLTSGFNIPLSASTTDWNIAFVNRITGVNGPLSLLSNALSITRASSTADGYLASTDFAAFTAKESAIAASTTSSYFRGDKTFQALDTSAVAENGNLYFTALRASTTAGQVVAAATSTVRNFISSSASGLTYAPSTGIFSLTSGFAIPLTASTSDWASFFNTPSSRITAGGALAWTGNTLSVATSSLGLTTTNVAEGNNLYYTTARASTTAIQVLAATTSLPNITTLSGITSFGTANITTTAAGSFAAGTTTVSGRLSVGTTPPAATLGVKGTAGTSPFVVASSTGSQLLTLLQSGNLGVGTTNPLYKFDITQSGSASGFHLGGDSTDKGLYITNVPGTNDTYFGNVAFNSSGQWVLKSTYGSFTGFDSSGTSFYSDSGLTTGAAYTPTRRMLITPTGNVGIGTTPSTAKLEVAGETLGQYFTANTQTESTLPRLVSTNATSTTLAALTSVDIGSGNLMLAAGEIGLTNTLNIWDPINGANSSFIGYGGQNDASYNHEFFGTIHANSDLFVSGTLASDNWSIDTNGNFNGTASNAGYAYGAGYAFNAGSDFNSFFHANGYLGGTNLYDDGTASFGGAVSGGSFAGNGFIGYNFGNSNIMNSDAPNAATGYVTLTGVPSDGDMVTISDGIVTYNFEFDNDSNLQNGGDYGVTIGGGTTATAYALYASVGSSGMNMSYSIDDTIDTVYFTNSSYGIAGNVTITSTAADITLSGMSGGYDGGGYTGSYAFGSGNTILASGAHILGSSITNNIADSVQIGPNNASKITINSSGNVGIGTTTPSNRLSIGSRNPTDSTDRKAIELNAGGYGAPGAYGSNSNGDKIILYRDAAANYDSTIGVGAAGDTWFKSFGPSTTGQFGWYTGGSSTARMVLDPLGNLGVGTTTPGSKLSVGGDINFTGDIYRNGVLYSQTLATSQWTTSGSNIYYNTGSIGIGTAAPDSQFHVSGSSTGATIVQGKFENVNDFGRSQFIVTSGTYPNNFFALMTHGSSFASDNYLNDGTSDAGLGLLLGQGTQMTKFAVGTYDAKPLALFTSNTERLSITSSGTVGIGTTTPAAKLAVSGTAGVTTDIFSVASSTNAKFFTVTAAGNVGVGSSTPSAKFAITGTAGTADIFAVASSTDARLFTITSDGKVGIGTTTPSARLGLYGIAGTSDIFAISSSSNSRLLTFTSAGELGVGTSTPSAKLAVSGTAGVTTDIFSVASSTNAKFFTVTAAGNVGVGSSTPIGTLSVKGSAALDPFIVASSTDSRLLTLNALGNLGLGTTTPSAKLAVSGTAGVTSDIFSVASSTDAKLFTVKSTGFVGIGTAVPTSALTFADASTIDSIGSLTIKSTTTNALTLDSGTTGAIGIGTSANAKTITLGNGTGATSLVLNAGTGNIDIGVNDFARNINIGTGGTAVQTIAIGGAAANVITIGTTQTAGSISLGDAMTGGTINIGGTGLQTGTIGLGTGTGAQTISLGTGTGLKTLSIGGTGANVIAIGNTQTGGSIAMGAAMTGGTITIGGTGLQTGTIAIGTGTGAQTINLGTGGTGAKTIAIGTAAVANTITIGNSTGATSIALTAGTGGISLTGNTGVGTTTPVAKLDIYGTAGAADIFAVSSSTNSRLITVTAAGRMGIGTSTPLYPFHVQTTVAGGVAGFTDADGTCTVDPTSTSLVCSSDRRLKKDIVSINSITALDKINQLQGVNFRWNNQTSDTLRYGFIAQDLEQIFPELVQTDINGFKSVAYTALTPVLAEAIKQLDVKVNDLNARVSTSTLKSMILDMGDWVVTKITAPFASFKHVETETASVSNGLEMKDSASGQVWCVRITNGEWAKVPGKCSDAAPAVSTTQPSVTPASPAPAATTTPPVAPAPAASASSTEAVPATTTPATADTTVAASSTAPSAMSAADATSTPVSAATQPEPTPAPDLPAVPAQGSTEASQ